MSHATQGLAACAAESLHVNLPLFTISSLSGQREAKKAAVGNDRTQILPQMEKALPEGEQELVSEAE